MRLVIFGATGGTGREFVRQAAARGHHVTAAARTPQTMEPGRDNIDAVSCDVTDRSSVARLVRECDAVLSALGARSMSEETRVYSDGAANILHAMSDAGVRRFMAVSAVPVGQPQNVVERAVIFPILYRFFGKAYADMRRMEALVTASDSDWTIFRPPQLVDRPGSGKYRVAADAPLGGAWRISRADLASAMLAALSDETTFGHVITIAD